MNLFKACTKFTQKYYNERVKIVSTYFIHHGMKKFLLKNDRIKFHHLKKSEKKIGETRSHRCCQAR